MTTIRLEYMRPSRPTEVGAARAEAGVPICLIGRSDPATAAVDPAFHSIWVSLKGQLRLELQDGSLTLGPRRFFVGAGDAPLRGCGEGGAWTVLAIPRPLAGQRVSPPPVPPDLLPVVLGLDRMLLRAIARLLRGCADASVSPWFQQALLRDVLDAIVHSQRRLRPLIERCPGRTDEQRRTTLSRLLRARQAYELRREEPFSVETMAELAHYSPCHFVRVFQQVFDESPLEFMIAHRMHRARTLLEDTGLAITEISHRVGYANSATFARIFKAYHGHTASEARWAMRCRRSGRDGDIAARATSTRAEAHR